MKKLNQAELYKEQISLTEWFENLKHNSTENLRVEDNVKRDRLGILNTVINLPYDKPVQFRAEELTNNSTKFRNFFSKHKNELCALRLIPIEENLPKLRLRGLSIAKVMDWFREQKIDPLKYKADFIPHGDHQKFSTIFIVNKNGIFGEIIKGGHYQLTQGFYDQGVPIAFSYDFKLLTVTEGGEPLKKYLLKLFRLLEVKDRKKQTRLKRKLKASFYHNYLAGYFETVDTKEFGLWFVDYNRLLGEMYNDFTFQVKKEIGANSKLKGQVASHGKVKGKARIIKAEDIATAEFFDDEILVSDMTTPDFLPLMQKALGIVTDLGGILSHAAIISRELRKPCITGTRTATQVIKNGDMIEIDTEKSEIIIL